MSLYGLWLQRSPERNVGHFAFTKQFCQENFGNMLLWGEGAIPQFLAYYWFAKVHDATQKSDMLLANLIAAICARNHPESKHPLADPYLDAEAALRLTASDDDDTIKCFAGTSYTVEGLLHLLAKRNWKQAVKDLWPGVTRLGLQCFEPEHLWQYYLWRNERGVNATKHPPLTKSWDSLRAEASNAAGDTLGN
jgi:hypothetical protein